MNSYSLLKKYTAAAGAGALLLLAAAGCTDELEVQPLQSSEYLNFNVALQPDGRNAASRGSVANVTFTEEEWALAPGDADGANSSRAQVTGSLSGKARIYAYGYDDPADMTNVIDGKDYTFVDNMLTCKDDNPPKWSDISHSKLNVYAYTPVTQDTENIYTIIDGKPAVVYTINKDVAKQEDLIFANTSVDVAANKRKPLNLTFKHALTAVRFKAGFSCTVKSIEVVGVYNRGTYAIWDNSEHGNWNRLNMDDPTKDSYKVSFGEAGLYVPEGGDIVAGENTLILMPQALPEGAKVVLTLSNRPDIEIPLAHFVWDPGMMVTYTIYESEAPSYIYFDLAAGNVSITGTTYKGYRFSPDGKTTVTVSGTIRSGEEYYVYQSTPTNRANIWTADENGNLLTFSRPEYGDVIIAGSGKSWKEYITNNSSVEDVIKNWEEAATAAGMQPTDDNYISVSGTINTCKITIDNIYSRYDERGQGRTTAGIIYKPSGSNNRLTLDIVGDNRLGAIHYDNRSNNGNKLILKGNGSLTLADTKGNNSNWWCSVIGNNDNNNDCYGIQIDGGVIFAGSKEKEDCTAIGGGGNGTGEVTITGGVVTAVAATTGTAIGGGIGHSSPGGIGLVTITGGTIYAYNHHNQYSIPVAAIGGAGSNSNIARNGTKIKITGGTIYAKASDGPAIGAGGSYRNLGGDANIIITGGDITARTENKFSCAIGGGTSYSIGGAASNFNGGDAEVTISGNPVIRTGSIGGGITGATGSKIGSAKIDISGGTIQAQFLLAAGSTEPPSFTMSGGTINGSLADNSSFMRKKEDGGAVYMEDGIFTFTDGVIENCTGVRGGAVYLAGGEFLMSGGIIRNCESTSHGGAIFMNESSVNISGGEISNNLAYGGNGGGVYIIGNDFHMSGSTRIQGNSAINTGNDGGYGGGVYVFSDKKDVTVDLLSGSITQNSSEKKGGGVCVVINSDHRAIVTVGENGAGNTDPLISRNHTLLQGAGLHVQGTNADITINSGKIKDNKVGAYVPNNDVSNEGGLVILNGGDVTHNVITFHANYAGADPASTQQNVVTATRSQLIAPDLQRQGYTLDGWTTKADGTGDLYHDGNIINTDTDMNLYAKWLAN